MIIDKLGQFLVDLTNSILFLNLHMGNSSDKLSANEMVEGGRVETKS